MAASVLLLAGYGLGTARADSKPTKPASKTDFKSGSKLDDADALRAKLEGKTPQQRIDLLTAIVESGKPTKETYFHLGNAKFEKGDAAGAAQAFEQAVAMDSTFFKAVVNLGLMYDEQQNWPKAIENFEAAARLQPDSPDVYSHMGNTYYAQRKYKEAMELYRKSLKMQPNAAHALYSLGVAFADAGIFREAVRYWKRVVELEPSSELGKNASENVQLLQKYLIP